MRSDSLGDGYGGLVATAVKIGLGIFLGGILLVGACAALIAGGSSLEEPTGEDTGLEDTGDAAPKRSPQRTRRFSGNGSKNIGTIRVTDDAVLAWKHKSSIGGGYFIVMDEEAKINVNSSGRRGSSALEPGTYRNVDVTADGDWSMSIRGR